MKVLLLTHSFNSLTQRLYVEIERLGHEVSVEFDINDRVTEEAVDLFQPDILIAPFLKRAIPESIWSKLTCLIVHPGPKGDRGPSSLDWAILRGKNNGVLPCCKPLPTWMPAPFGRAVVLPCATHPKAAYIATKFPTARWNAFWKPWPNFKIRISSQNRCKELETGTT
ncbi:hypothetical protein [Terasakiella sp.]|uniref:hypothetical protein n=1 Tax=Terasakiella sp. TaxID=2034861 RepID=UPI003B0034AF